MIGASLGIYIYDMFAISQGIYSYILLGIQHRILRQKAMDRSSCLVLLRGGKTDHPCRVKLNTVDAPSQLLASEMML